MEDKGRSLFISKDIFYHPYWPLVLSTGLNCGNFGPKLALQGFLCGILKTTFCGSKGYMLVR